jgi:VanZ family protein
MSRHRSSATGLAWVYATLVVYASLFPFEGWRWPPGQSLLALLVLPSALHQSVFDISSNLLGYAPLGLFAATARLRNGARLRHALLSAGLGGALLSWGCEVGQHFMPTRVPAFEDWIYNTGGAFGGALLAVAAHRAGLVERWSRLRARWFSGDAAPALVLLVLWPVGLLFPAPLPLGLGQVGERLREGAAEFLEGVPWAEPALAWLSQPASTSAPLRPLSEALLVGCGLLAPCLVAYAVVSPGWRRLALAGGAALLALSAMSLSTLLNFGPQHAFTWVGPAVVPGMALGLLAAVLLVGLPRRMVPGIGLMVLTALVAGVAQAPSDPYFAQTLQAWEQGRFVRFHGLAQWVGWLWPYAAMAWLIARLGTRA